MLGSLEEHHFWVHLCFSSSVPHILFVLFYAWNILWYFVCVCVCIYIYIYIYICMYVCILSSTDCLVVSQPFSVARHVGCLKLGSKSTQLYARLSIRPFGQQAYHIGKGIIRYFVATAVAMFVCLHFIPYQIPECSIRSKSFALCEWQPKIPLPECSTPMGQCIYCHPQTDCFGVSQLFSVASLVTVSPVITWCDRQQLWKAVITGDMVTRLSIPIRGRG